MALSKEQISTVKDIIKNIKDAKDGLDVHLKEVKSIVEDEGGRLEELKNELEDQYEEMTEKVQEGEKGTKLQEITEKVGDVIDTLEGLEETLSNSPLDEPLSEIEELLSK